MANPRQRRKQRSATHRAVSHARHAKRNLKKTPPIRGPAILSERWDNTKTVRQNYAALGLVHTLNPSASGGVEPMESAGSSEDSPVNLTAASTSSQTNSNSAPPIPKGHGRILRDADGTVLGIELADEDEEMAQDDDREKDMEETAPEVDAYVREKWITGLGGGPKGNGDGNVVEELERISSVRHSSTATTLSASISGAGPRQASAGEAAYLQRLVDKYGSDVEQMARDRKLNPEQRTAGQLRRSVKRCFETRS